MVKTISKDSILGLDFKILNKDKNRDSAIGVFCTKIPQIVVPSVFKAPNEKYFLINNHSEVNTMIRYGLKEIQVLVISEILEVDFKVLRLLLANINLEFDHIVCSESISELTRTYGIKNLSSKLGIDKDIFNSYEKLLDFNWGFTSKKEKKKEQLNPDQIGINWDNL